MNLSGFLPLIGELPAYRQIVQELRDARTGAAACRRSLGLVQAAVPYLLASLQRDHGGVLLALTAHPERARQLHELLTYWSPSPNAVLHFPASDSLFYDRSAWASENIQQRVTMLSMLATWDESRGQEAGDGGASVIVTSIPALLLKTALPSHLRNRTLSLAVNQRVDLEALLGDLLRYGYQPTSVVEEPGEFSRRGGIVDVFSPNWEQPVRVELFGDEIESLRAFDPETQRSSRLVESVSLCAASEAVPSYGKLAAKKLARMNLSQLQALPRQRWQQDMENLEYGQAFRGIEFYLPLLYSQSGSLLDYLPQGSLVLTEDSMALSRSAQHLIDQARETRDELVAENTLVAEFPTPFHDWAKLSGELENRPGLDLVGLGATPADALKLEAFGPADSYGGKLEDLLQDYATWRDQGQRVLIVSRQAERLDDLFRQEQIYPMVQEEISELPRPGSLALVKGTLGSGWSLDLTSEQGQVQLVVLADTEVFGWAKYSRKRKIRHRSVSPETFFADLKLGDYVVQVEHGVARYGGLQRKTVDGIEREYLELKYAEGDRLYVPVSQADRVARYVGAGADPTLHRLGTADWGRVKAQAKKAVEDIAKDLLQLYAARHIVPGHAFSSDTAWQVELEAAFPYEETEDQLSALEAVKRDMERPIPMDRLVCGDVGYGKTEVALRAAFKAIMDGKQVAILVPTTVLAQQHYLTFRDRLEAFPIEVEMLSRFRSRREQTQILKRLSAGQVDLIVGTHRLIQRDVEFKELGLLIIDEEQRFGVVHKERLKQMRSQVDVLTLTATPIPRTLYMALTGARDMSVIDTPPEERLPIRTQIAENNDTLIRSAILREIGRGGQVYFVHNRVRGIRQIAQHLAQIVPEARLAIGHGQMPEEQLSQIMLDFMAGKFDVLVCTTIIESGLDIPNANTIIINRADMFGLAQLYQLRGRVGRSSMQAYAYLLYNKGKPLPDVAQMRLETIMEASELGAGYRVAMRDLEIRGAGEILGARQHGQIAAVGFDLYTRLLAQAVRELQAKEGGPEIEAHLPFSTLAPLTSAKVDLPLSAHVPDDYLEDSALRLKLYQRMANLNTLAEIDEISQELSDRFGALPESVANLLYLLRIRTLATEIGATSVARNAQRVVIRFDRSEDLLPMKACVIRFFGNVAQVRPALITLPWGRGGSVSQQTLLQVLETMAQDHAGQQPA